uniref:Uncharacterized protein n=1 Tax=Chromera velia CCMP2878 TaxID=1169474 RepID=A0A0G4HCG7_9ALVE|eukprot:Cvel_6318.t1-p1 / transcript=Cvel_6318.t1 / gene=Cvel_6318 / organism=Chromera_velia_CCMP2878 / gene_product=hypothetical protein / transcript_product=hypothetical protein / location=Cvel_scaffold306:87933-88247(+) / protein_length=105 / sequence_SO=supercontig / SO=protein_coding / is_pseudo=false
MINESICPPKEANSVPSCDGWRLLGNGEIERRGRGEQKNTARFGWTAAKRREEGRMRGEKTVEKVGSKAGGQPSAASTTQVVKQDRVGEEGVHSNTKRGEEQRIG